MLNYLLLVGLLSEFRRKRTKAESGSGPDWPVFFMVEAASAACTLNVRCLRVEKQKQLYKDPSQLHLKKARKLPRLKLLKKCFSGRTSESTSSRSTRTNSVRTSVNRVTPLLPVIIRCLTFEET